MSDEQREIDAQAVDGEGDVEHVIPCAEQADKGQGQDRLEISPAGAEVGGLHPEDPASPKVGRTDEEADELAQDGGQGTGNGKLQKELSRLHSVWSAASSSSKSRRASRVASMTKAEKVQSLP